MTRHTGGYDEDELAEIYEEPDGEELSPRSLKITIAVITGVVFADIIAAVLLAALIALVVALTLLTFSFLIVGTVCVAGGQTIDVGGLYMIHIPHMPYICSALFGLSQIALAVLFCVAAEYSRLYAIQALRKVKRWNENTLRIGGSIAPPLPLQPWITVRKRAVLRAMAIHSPKVFAIALVVGFIAMVIAARSLAPWNVWGWFEGS